MSKVNKEDKERNNDNVATEAKSNSKNNNGTNGMNGIEELRRSPMIANLLDSLQKGTDVGHYGRLTFAMVARFFLSDDEIIKLLANQPDQNEDEARSMLHQVQAHNYNPPKKERILEWQRQQDFQICSNPDDPDSCNVYQDLRFPNDIYDNIQEYWDEKVESSQQ